MVANLSAEQISRLKVPCQNRDLKLIDLKNGTVMIDGRQFGTMNDVQNFLQLVPRTDLANRKSKIMSS